LQPRDQWTLNIGILQKLQYKKNNCRDKKNKPRHRTLHWTAIGITYLSNWSIKIHVNECIFKQFQTMRTWFHASDSTNFFVMNYFLTYLFTCCIRVSWKLCIWKNVWFIRSTIELLATKHYRIELTLRNFITIFPKVRSYWRANLQQTSCLVLQRTVDVAWRDQRPDEQVARTLPHRTNNW